MFFFFFPFYTGSQPSSNGRSSSEAKTLPLLPASGSAKRSANAGGSAGDFGEFALSLLQQTMAAFSASLTALGNQANALFAQLAATLALDRSMRSTASLFDGSLFGFGSQKARQGPFGFPLPGQAMNPMSFSPLLTQGFSPWAVNPWGAFTDGMNFWQSMWMPSAPKRGPFGNSAAAPFTAKISAPNGVSFGFSWGA